MKNVLSVKIFTTAFSVSGLLTFASPVQAQVWEKGRCQIDTVATIQGLECLMVRILNIATTFIGLAAFVMLIIGAFLYLTSGSSPKGAEAGRTTMTYAIIGIVVSLMGAFVLNLISGFTGVTGILNFNLFLQ